MPIRQSADPLTWGLTGIGTPAARQNLAFSAFTTESHQNALIAATSTIPVMLFPKKFLVTGETVELDVHPHWSSLTPVVLPPVVLLVVTSFVQAESWLHGITSDLFLVLWAAVLLHSAYRWACYYAINFVVTTSRIVYRHGLFARTDQEIPLSKVTNISVHRSFIDRFMRNGTLIVESAGRDSAARFTDIAHVETVQRLILQLRENPVVSPPTSEPTGPSNLADQLERLANLHNAGKLTNDEFTAAKSALLGK